MKNFLKIFGFVILGLMVAAYAGFLFVLPNTADLNKYIPEIQKIAKEQANIEVNFQNPKIITTPLLGAGIKTENITVKLPDGSLLFSADSIKTRIALPSLFLLTAKVSCFEVENPFINLEIKNNEDYKVVMLIEDILNAKKEKTFAEKPEVKEGLHFNPAWIRIKVPCVKLNNYKVLVTDLNTKHYLDLHGNQLKAGYFNGKTAKIKTYAELYNDEQKNLALNLDINSFLPKHEPSLDAEDDPAERIDIPFTNPVDVYRNYDLKANVDTKLRIRNHKGHLTSYGHLNIEGITLKISQLVLPESYLRIKTFGSVLDMDTNIYAAKDANLQLLGKLNYGKNPKTDMYIKTGTIQFNDLLLLGKAFLDSLRIKNELGQYKAEGSLNADCHIKTNFKKLESNGYIKIQNGSLSVRNIGKVISGANINLLLDNNILKIENSGLLVNKSKITFDGNIDEKSVSDIKVNAERIPLPSLFYAFAPKETRNAFNFGSGDATLNLSINGKLKNAIASADLGLDNLNLSDGKNSFIVKNKNLKSNFVFNSKLKTLEGNINNEGFMLTLPATGSNINAPKLEIKIAGKNINIAENNILINSNSNILYSGEITNYENPENMNFLAEGTVDTNDLIRLIGKEFKPYFHAKGSVPVKLTFEGNKKKQTLLVQALANKHNFFTPADFKELQDKDISLQSVIDFKPNRIKIKKTGLFKRTMTVDEKGNEIINLENIIDIDGTIAGNRINLIKINIPNALNGNIFAFPRSEFELDKAHLFVFGQTSNPIIRGAININKLNIPEILTSIENIKLHFSGHDLDFGTKNINLNGSDISIKGILDLNPSDITNINKLEITSNFINLEKMLKVTELLQKYTPQTTSSKSAHKNQSSDIPVVINNGNIDMKRIITGNIEVLNTISQLSLIKNVLYLNNLKTNIFKGNVNGDIAVNLNSMLIGTELHGENINVAKAMLDAAGMKDMLSGTAEFNANLSIDGSASTQEEQIKGINGDIEFLVKNGQFGPFGKIENLIIAENIRESQFFQTALGGIINSLTSIDTTHFSELKGKLVMDNGICRINPITSQGGAMTLHIFGDFDIPRNYADMKVRAKMASLISNLLGPIGAISPAKLMDSAASLNVVTAKAFSIFCEMVPETEFSEIPNFENDYVDNSAMKFQIVVKGDAAKPLTLVKSFKWLASKAEYEAAENFVESLPEPIEGSTATNIQEAIAEAQALEAEKKTLKYKVKHIFTKNKNN